MDRQIDRARQFAALHVKGEPVVLYNAWDAGSATAVAAAGATAIATGSWSVAAAQGYPDGEAIPLETLGGIVRRIAASVDLPVSVDLEGGYAIDPDATARNIERIVAAGAIGINFEDGVVGAPRQALHGIDLQCARIRAIRRMADENGLPLFINARTDLFLQTANPEHHGAHLGEALERAAAYAEAGASGFFVPGLATDHLIERVCSVSRLPVNVMMRAGVPHLPRLAELGVSRVSYGPAPYRAAMAWLQEQATAAMRREFPAGGSEPSRTEPRTSAQRR